MLLDIPLVDWAAAIPLGILIGGLLAMAIHAFTTARYEAREARYRNEDKERWAEDCAMINNYRRDEAHLQAVITQARSHLKANLWLVEKILADDQCAAVIGRGHLQEHLEALQGYLGVEPTTDKRQEEK